MENTFKNPKIVKLLCGSVIFAMIFSNVAVLQAPKTASAQAVPISTDTDSNITQQHMKDYVLDRLATLVAKQLLHQLTGSIINWINKGFKGKPSFLTNPEGFFIDVADQVTGAFLATNGPLRSLCEPFSIDIRLSLALDQTQFIDQRYECTLSKIIKNVKNLPDNVSINGQTLSGFMNGDFSQGGWPLFVEMTTEPKNNPYGALLYARSDLRGRIGEKQNAIRADLQLGSGIMSYQTCDDVMTITDTKDENQLAQGDELEYSDPSIQRKVNKDGSIAYQRCTTQTPGSAITGLMGESLQGPLKELELANNINAVITALVNQLITKTLSSGFSSLSKGRGDKPALTMQVINDASYAQDSVDTLQTAIEPAIDDANSYKDNYDHAVSELQDANKKIESARTCLREKISQSTALEGSDLNTYMLGLDKDSAVISTNLVLMLPKQEEAAKITDELRSISDSISGTGSMNVVKEQTKKYQQFMQGHGADLKTNIKESSKDYANVQTIIAEINPESKYTTYCSGVTSTQ